MCKVGVVGKRSKWKGRVFQRSRRKGVELLHVLVGCSVAFGEITTIFSDILKVII